MPVKDSELERAKALQYLGESGQIGHLGYGDSRFSYGTERTSRAYQLNARSLQFSGEINYACLIVYTEDCLHRFSRLSLLLTIDCINSPG